MSVTGTGYQSRRKLRRALGDLLADEMRTRTITISETLRRTMRAHRGTRAEKRRFVRESKRRARRLTVSIALKEERRDLSDIFSQRDGAAISDRGNL
jgi:hypothetical protein